MNKDLVAAAVVVGAAFVFAVTTLVQNHNSMARRRAEAELPSNTEAQTIPAPEVVTAPRVYVPPPLRPANETVPLVVQQPATKPSKSPLPPRPKNVANPIRIVMDEPRAREALALVGSDPDAEAAWAQAIDDPNFSANFRKDLIEDLNDQGFENLRQLTEDDLIIVQRRLALIEAMAPHAMDDTNAAAFAEAHKDLTNMLARGAGN